MLQLLLLHSIPLQSVRKHFILESHLLESWSIVIVKILTQNCKIFQSKRVWIEMICLVSSWVEKWFLSAALLCTFVIKNQIFTYVKKYKNMGIYLVTFIHEKYLLFMKKHPLGTFYEMVFLLIHSFEGKFVFLVALACNWFMSPWSIL